MRITAHSRQALLKSSALRETTRCMADEVLHCPISSTLAGLLCLVWQQDCSQGTFTSAPWQLELSNRMMEVSRGPSVIL